MEDKEDREDKGDREDKEYMAICDGECNLPVK